MGAPRTFSPGNFALELGGVSAGYLMNVQGGGAVAEVVSEKPGADHIVHKHIGNVRYEDIVLTCGTGMSKDFYDWVGQSSRMDKAVRKSGAVIVCDNSNKELSRLQWFEGQITEIGLPALDAASRDQGSLTVKIAPERIKNQKGDGKAITIAQTRQSWLSNSFRLKIGGLEEACRRVTRIEPITISWKAAKDAVGEMRDYSIELGSYNPGNLVITLPEAHADGFIAWFEDFVIDGNNGPEKEKDGVLDYLTPDLKSGLFTLTFRHLGPMRMTKPSGGPGKEIRKVQIDMYCESIAFSASSGA